MEKTEENVLAIAESVIALEAPDARIDLRPFAHAYISGASYTPSNETEEEIISIVEDMLWHQFNRYKPSEKQAWEDNAPRIPVKIAGKEYQTFLDESGVQRFCGNSVIARIMSSSLISDSHGELSINTLVVDYHKGMFSSEDWLDFMTSFGYSVSGLLGWDEFQHLPVENPLWEE